MIQKNTDLMNKYQIVSYIFIHVQRPYDVKHGGNIQQNAF